MGCTSSAPNTIPPNASTADKTKQFEEETNDHPSIEVDVADIEDENRTNETKVLPSCDTFEETVQLVRHNQSSTNIMTEKDVPANGHVNENDNTIKISEYAREEVKIPKLELFMDKVLQTNQHLIESEQKVQESEKTPADSSKLESVENTENKVDGTDTAADTEYIDKPEIGVENAPDAAPEETKETSPSQSQSSRATRWEALADIAAELPPSLAVDPITGQIYQIGLIK